MVERVCRFEVHKFDETYWTTCVPLGTMKSQKDLLRVLNFMETYGTRFDRYACGPCAIERLLTYFMRTELAKCLCSKFLHSLRR